MSTLVITGSPEGSQFATWEYVPYQGYRGDFAAFSAARGDGELFFDQTYTYSNAATITPGTEDSLTVIGSTFVSRTLREFTSNLVPAGSFPFNSEGQGCDNSQGSPVLFSENFDLPSYHEIESRDWDHSHTEDFVHRALWDGVVREIPATRTYDVYEHDRFEGVAGVGSALHQVTCVTPFPPGPGNNYFIDRIPTTASVTKTKTFDASTSIQYSYNLYILPDKQFSGFENISRRETLMPDGVNFYHQETYTDQRQHIEAIIHDDLGESCLYIQESTDLSGSLKHETTSYNAIATEGRDSLYSYVIGFNYDPQVGNSPQPDYEDVLYRFAEGQYGQPQLIFFDGNETINLGNQAPTIGSQSVIINGSGFTDLSLFAVGDSVTLSRNFGVFTETISQISGTTEDWSAFTKVPVYTLDSFNGSFVWLVQESNGSPVVYKCTVTEVTSTTLALSQFSKTQVEGSFADRSDFTTISEIVLQIIEKTENTGHSFPYYPVGGRIGAWSCNTAWDLYEVLRQFNRRSLANVKKSAIEGALWECFYSQVDQSSSDNPTPTAYTSVITLKEDGSIEWNPRNIAPANARFWKPEDGANVGWIKWSN